MCDIVKSQDHQPIAGVGRHPVATVSPEVYATLKGYSKALRDRACIAINEVHRRFWESAEHLTINTSLNVWEWHDGFDVVFQAAANRFEVFMLFAEQPRPETRVVVSAVRYDDGRAPLEIVHPDTTESPEAGGLEVPETDIGPMEDASWVTAAAGWQYAMLEALAGAEDATGHMTTITMQAQRQSGPYASLSFLDGGAFAAWTGYVTMPIADRYALEEIVDRWGEGIMFAEHVTGIFAPAALNVWQHTVGIDWDRVIDTTNLASIFALTASDVRLYTTDVDWEQDAEQMLNWERLAELRTTGPNSVRCFAGTDQVRTLASSVRLPFGLCLSTAVTLFANPIFIASGCTPDGRPLDTPCARSTAPREVIMLAKHGDFLYRAAGYACPRAEDTSLMDRVLPSLAEPATHKLRDGGGGGDWTAGRPWLDVNRAGNTLYAGRRNGPSMTSG